MEGKPKFGRLVLVVYPFLGHINPMLQLATVLHAKGFSITIVHPEFNSPDPSNHPQFSFLSIPDKLSESNILAGDFMGTIRALNINCLEPFQVFMKKMVEEEKLHDRIVAVVYDALMYFAQTVADALYLPGFVVRTSAAANLLVSSMFRQPGEEQGYISLLETLPQDLGPELQSLKLEDVLASKGYPTETLVQIRANLTSAMQKSSAIIVNTMQFLEQETIPVVQKYFPSQLILSMGPFHKLALDVSASLLNEDNSCLSWLEKQSPNSVIYVSFGSMASMSEDEFFEVAWGLADSEQPFLWVVRPGMVLSASNLNELLPEKFYERVGERGCIVQWTPQKEVLAHTSVGGFWTHCGWNSTLESVSEGVPMLCKPFFGDQLLNVRYICDVWKIGIELEGELERGKIENAVRKLMVSNDGEVMRQRALELKDKVELCLNEGGSTHESLNALAKLCLSNSLRDHSYQLKFDIL